jgi:hypothetical protein
MQRSPLNRDQKTDALIALTGPVRAIAHCVASGLLLATLSLPALVHAGDEDLNPSVYQEFDPVTGFVIDVVPPPDDQQAAAQNHTASTPATTPSVVADPAAATASEPVVTAETGSSGALNPLIIAGGILLAGLVGAFILGKRKGTGS